MWRLGRHAWRTALLGLALPALAAAQTHPTYTVRGTVADAVTGQPIARAMVEITSTAAALTNAYGQFELDGIPAGYQTISAGKPGYASLGTLNIPHAVPPEGYPPQPLGVDVGPGMRDVALTLTPEAVMAGKVTSASGNPLENVLVEASRQEPGFGGPQWRQVANVTTGFSGNFRFGGLPAGQYYLYATNGPRGEGWLYLPAYYPGRPASGDYVTLRAGSAREIEISMTRAVLYPVAVTASTPGLNNCFPTEVTDLEGAMLPWGGGRAGKGVCHIMLPSGTWILIESRYGKHGWYGSSEVTVAGAPATASIAVSPYEPVPVEIDREFTQAGPPDFPQGLGANLSLVPADPNAGLYPGSVQAGRNSDGTTSYTVTQQSPGQYWLATQSGNAYVSSATQGGTDLAQEPATLGPGAAPIDITLRNDFGTIAAQVQLPNLGAAPPTVYLCAIPLFPTTERPWISGWGGQPGAPFLAVQLRVPPGSYRLVAFRRPVSLHARARDLASAWPGEGQTLDVAAGQTVHITVSTIAAHSASEAQRRYGDFGAPARQGHKRDARHTGPGVVTAGTGSRAGARASQ